MNVGIEGVAYCLGSDIVSNKQLEAEHPDWDIARAIERTGVSTRAIAGPATTALDLGHTASVKLLQNLNLQPSEIDAVIFCTQTPDHLLPPNSTLLHGRLGMPNGVMAFDITHACSGFLYGLGIARSLVLSGTASRALLVTSDTYSRLIHPFDRSTRLLFGDGGAATIVSAINPSVNVLDMSFSTAGKHAERFMVRNGGFRHERRKDETPVIDKVGRVASPDHIQMDGMGVLSFFNSAIPKAVKDLLNCHQKSIDDISIFVFHQASRLALEGIGRSLGISGDRMPIDLAETGNLVSASVPVALAHVLANRNIKPGQFGVLCGFGVGLSWSTALVKF